MSLPPKHDPTSYDESEETVPLYTEREDGPAIADFDDIESRVELTSLPDEKATADEVREFFVRLLLSARCNFSRDNARRTAAMWQAGSGREVKSYPAAMYLDLFGKEKGWIIYKEVFVLGQRKQPGKMTFKMKCFVAAGCLAVFELLMGLLLLVDSVLVTAVCGMLGFFGMLIMVTTLLVALLNPKPETQAENLLRQAIQSGGSSSGQ